jgi:2-polyprenyl-3-methyl-5-hydroxy-6-metoxy-1,4-benzoquinol methylase
MQTASDWSGERLETYITNEIMVEHIHRYAIACELVQNKKVLDIACGEGYGSYLMANDAFSVTGIDINSIVIEKAREKYKRSNLQFLQGPADKIPVEDHVFDIVVSFETIEHLENHQLIFNEIKRVLKPEGVLIISTPNKLFYSDKNGYVNPFHKKELYLNEFKDLLSKSFINYRVYSQTYINGSLIREIDSESIKDVYSGSYQNFYKMSGAPMLFMIAIASDQPLIEISGSIFIHPKSISEMMKENEQIITSSITYKLGNILLFPFKAIRGLLKK